MSKIMLIDAAHAEETRVAVVNDRRVEEFDFESRDRKQLRGNIYLAKVTRVEPSLQAAFIEYGGNRHGFLAFNEIHPDYYQIPVADREAIMAEDETDEEKAEAAAEDDHDEGLPAEEAKLRRRLMRRYKIQEVIKRRQILLVQVVKEERGGKGAALTTWLSLAGRYCVLMPNTGKGGGISRKITAAADRKRLKAAAQSLEVPHGMGLIIRTAGAKRTKAEIQRDYEYLIRLWEDIRETTLNSIAPTLIYEEENLVRRAVRDMFDKDFESVQVEGEEAWREARDFMRVLTPSQAKKVQLYEGSTPLLVKYKVEDTLAQLQTPVVQLKSGGYLVINQTEALVAIDVNSGKATKERNIEATAYKTNMEAAEEAARQMRLRDLAGLIVIDFIDMDESKNNRAVEKCLKDALESDRARIQMGKISQFGLMEISRQRRRMGLLEGVTHVCEHCSGTGRLRSTESSALLAMRAAEMEAGKGAGSVVLRAPSAVALYILNHKRDSLSRLQSVSGLFVTVQVDDSLSNSECAIDRLEITEAPPPVEAAVARGRVAYRPEDLADEEVDDDGFADEEEIEEEDTDDDAGEARRERRDDEDGEGARGERGRGRGRGRRRRGGRRDETETEAEAGEAEGDETPRAPRAEGDEDDRGGGRRRRRGRRGGRHARDEESSGGETYGWVRGRTPSVEDPYVWFDPLDRRPARSEQPAEPRSQERDGDEAAAPEAVRSGEEPRRRRVRRRRGGRGSSEVFESTGVNNEVESIEHAPADAVDAVEIEPEVDVTSNAEPVAEETVSVEAEVQLEPDVAIEPDPEPVAEAAPEPEPEAVSALEPAPVTEKAPLPGEITAPPEKPKRGWWRRF